MPKLSLEQAQKLSAEVSKGLGGVCNDVFDAIEDTPPGPALQASIDRGWAKVKQYEEALARFSDTHARQFRADYERKVTRLRNNLAVLEKKQSEKS